MKLAVALSCFGKIDQVATYSCPSFIASSPIDSLAQLPRVVVSHRSDDCLGDFGRSNEEVGAVGRRQLYDPCQGGRDPIDNCEQRWMYGRSQMVLPLLRNPSASALSACGILHTQVIHAPLSSPKAICQAGSND